MESDPRVDRVFARALELCDVQRDSVCPPPLVEFEVLAFARSVWMHAQETDLKQPSKELMVAFAEAVNMKFVLTTLDFDCPDCKQKKGTPCTVRGDFHVGRSDLASAARINGPPLL